MIDQLVSQFLKATDNKKTYSLCALWLLSWWASNNGYISHDLYVQIFGQTGAAFPVVVAAIRSAIGENK